MKFQNLKELLRSQRGLTLVEILIVLAIIALVGGGATFYLFNTFEQQKPKITKQRIQEIEKFMMAFKLDQGFYPDTLQGLITAPEGGRPVKNYPEEGYMDANLLQDAWGNDFIYQSDGRRYEIISLGADGLEGGEGNDADISNRGTKPGES